MGNYSSSEKVKGLDQQEIQTLVKTYWDFKRSVEDQTLRFLGCVDVLESASAHILSCDDKNNGDQMKNFSLNPQARKLLSSSKAIEKDVKQSFVNEIDNFVEFISNVVGKLQKDMYEKCEIKSKYVHRLNEWEYKLKEDTEEKPYAEDVWKKRLEDLQKQIDNRDKIIKTLKEEKKVLYSINETLEKKDEEYSTDLMCKLESYVALNKEDNERLKKQLEALNEEKNKLKKDFDVLCEENHLQKKDLDGCRSKIVSLEQQSQYDNEKKYLQFQQQLHSKNDEYEQEKRKTLNMIEQLKKEMTEERLSEVNALKAKLNEQTKENEDLVRSLMTQHDEDKGKLEKEFADFKAKILEEHNATMIQLKQCQEKLNTMQTVKNGVDDELKQLKEELRSEKCKTGEDLRKRNDELVESKNEQIRLKRLLEELKGKLTKACADKSELEQKINKIGYTLSQKQEQVVHYKDDLTKVKNMLTDCQNEKKESEKKHHSAHEKCLDLESKLQQLHDKYNVCTREKDALKSELERKLNSTKTQLMLLQSNYRKLQNKEKEMKDDLLACHSKIATLSDDNKKLSDELSTMNSKRIIKVKLFAIRRPSTLVDFEDAVMAMLKSRIDDDVRELVFEQNDNPDVVNADTDATILLCFCGSRIGTDAEKSVEGLNLSPKMALVMIHHKDVHALPSQLSERVITGPEYKKLHLITDMAFLRDKGIFPCEINNNSVVKLVNFIKTEGKEYKKY